MWFDGIDEFAHLRNPFFFSPFLSVYSSLLMPYSSYSCCCWMLSPKQLPQISLFSPQSRFLKRGPPNSSEGLQRNNGSSIVFQHFFQELARSFGQVERRRGLFSIDFEAGGGSGGCSLRRPHLSLDHFSSSSSIEGQHRESKSRGVGVVVVRKSFPAFFPLPNDQTFFLQLCFSQIYVQSYPLDVTSILHCYRCYPRSSLSSLSSPIQSALLLPNYGS